MSYSFNVRAADKASARQKIGAEFDKVLASQPIHEADLTQAAGAANAFVDLLGEPAEGQEISVSVSGSVGKRADGKQVDTVTGAGVNVSVQILAKTG